jgi:ubiquinone/menaquinone biosynthesis C-methylase UbiE
MIGVNYVCGSVLDLPIENNSIDFVSINGVLVHLKNMGDVIKGLNKGARICKNGGYYFTAYGLCGGLMEGAIMPAIRKHYLTLNH